MEILDTILENASQPLYALTLLVALIKYPKYYSTPLKYFPILLMYTFLTELLGYFTKNYEVFHISIFSAFVREHKIGKSVKTEIEVSGNFGFNHVSVCLALELEQAQARSRAQDSKLKVRLMVS